MSALELRPHHLIDILRDYGKRRVFEPHPYGHQVHTVAACVRDDLDIEIDFVIGADSICEGCIHLQPDTSCDDVLAQLDPAPSKQAYNDALDARVFETLGLEPGCRMTARGFFQVVAEHMPAIAAVNTHPGEDPATRLQGVQDGLVLFGIVPSV